MDGAGSSSGGNVSSASQGTRPEYARQPNVKVNHFELKIQGKIVVYRYRVEIMEVDNDGQPLGESEDIWTSKKLRIFKEFARNELHNHHPIFDGQECFYSTIDLGLDQMEFVNESESNDGRRYKVRIHDKKKQEHSGHGTSLTSEFVQVLDVAIRCALSKKRKRIGRLLLHEEVDDHLVKIFGQQGLQPYRGILTSVRPGQSAMFLNVDTLLTGFYKTCPLTDLLPSSGNAGNTIDWQLDKDDMAFLKSLKGCKVEVKHLPYKRVRTIESITTKTAKEQELEEPSGSTRENKDRKIVAKNIAEYFNRYGGLRYPNLPCVKVTSRRTCYYPLEMCFLQWGQKGTSKLPGQLARPKERFELAEKVVKELNVKPSEYLDPFIERIVPEPVQTGYKIVSTSQTSRTMQVEGEVKWMIVNMCTESNHIGALLTGLVSRGAEMGVDMLAAKDVKIRAASTIDENLIKYLKAADFKLVLFILDSKNSDHYPHIKYLAEIKYGLQTQCVVYDKRITTPSFQKNVIRKIKAKLGYVDKAMPATINEFVFKDVLVMGADVSHHSPNDSKPSVAAIVASIDDRASRYVAVIRPQEKANDKKRVEIILYMKSVVEELFGHYKKENPGKIPKHILLYRDGVSEGEFEKVRTHELADLQSACTEVFQCIPQITFLTVQKRHRTRFMRGHDSNVPPGTVVETTITRPADNEFFLCSHTPIQGTARPAHYRVIADDYGFKPETLQKITFSLCHMYARCVTPVSIPAPVYYAHLAAARASCYMKVTQVDTNPIIIEKDLRDQMFFI
ncbi:protein argonaute-2 [Rhipicephalus sanguineus]|uniref:protein argonaute-2 n=1 Tax=Rhipicephalus sanguineus TaxID=34632 RepID=UPI001893D769|nr:protein argonaute-2 [Rhipicephalus sanguineus]